MAKIHPTAIVDSKAELADDVEIGPWTWIGPQVRLGPGCRIGQRVLIDGDTHLGKDCQIANGAVIGTEPQDLKYGGEPTRVRIGDQVTIREFATINRATGEGRATVIGNNVFLMAYSHVAHNCELEDEVIMANVATLAGHIHIGTGAIIGGLVAIHQFIRVGRLSIIGGGSGVRQDVLPFTMATGYPCRPYGLNRVGLRRRDFSAQRIRDLRQAYRILYRSGLSVEEATRQLKKELAESEDVQYLVRFVEGTSRRGFIR